MIKYRVNAVQFVYYSLDVEANDEDSAQELAWAQGLTDEEVSTNWETSVYELPPPLRTCSVCFKVFKDDSKFCSTCGSALSSENE